MQQDKVYPEPIEMTGVGEYAEGAGVELKYTDSSTCNEQRGERRLVIKAYNEGGYNCTLVDLLDLIAWLKANKPELLE